MNSAMDSTVHSTTTSTPAHAPGHTAGRTPGHASGNASGHVPVRSRANPMALPNILTYGRIAAVPFVVGCLFWQNILGGELWLRWLALVVFITAGVSDFLDGYFARIWGQQSSLGRMLDPIADKLLVASCLLILGAEKTIHGWSLLAAIVILCREILVSGLREYLAELRSAFR
jgi:cardiolipin synthase